jgi:hypothetical protein
MIAWISSELIYRRVWQHVCAPIFLDFITVLERRSDLHRVAVACVFIYDCRVCVYIYLCSFFLIGCSYLIGGTARVFQIFVFM